MIILNANNFTQITYNIMSRNKSSCWFGIHIYMFYIFNISQQSIECLVEIIFNDHLLIELRKEDFFFPVLMHVDCN